MACYQGLASQDGRQLAVHVAALLGAALQPSCPLSTKSCEAVPDVPRQRDLPWSAYSLGLFFLVGVSLWLINPSACCGDLGFQTEKHFLYNEVVYYAMCNFPKAKVASMT